MSQFGGSGGSFGPNAWLVDDMYDRFLADPHYGEAWGRMWLDLVRFAETAGYNADPTRPLAWKYSLSELLMAYPVLIVLGFLAMVNGTCVAAGACEAQAPSAAESVPI